MATHRKVDTFVASGTWTCPTGVTSVDIEATGAGGGGTINVGSGGGGAYAASTAVAVTPGNNYTITVGTSAANTNGGDSSFSTTVIAKGGLSGTNGSTGGTAAASTGTTKYNGGNGVVGTGARSGGGGAGTLGAGSGASGAAPNGGAGASTSATSAGKPNGGGGNSNTTTSTAGGRGWVKISYDITTSDGFPAVKSRSMTRHASSTSHVVTMPASISAGNLLILIYGCTDNPTITTPAGWTVLSSGQDTVPDVKSVVYYKTAAGGDTATIALSVSAPGASYVYCIDDWSGTPEAAVTTSTSSSVNSPSLTPTTGSDSYLWISAGILDWISTVMSTGTVPTSFDNFEYVVGITGGVGLLTSERRVNTATVDPASYGSTIDAMVSYTISVRNPIATTEVAITKSNKYTVIAERTPLTKGLRYVITDESAWYNTDWNKRVPITVEAVKVAEDNSDFPVYVNLGSLPADFHTNVKANGADIRMTAYDGTTEVPVEVVFYDAATDTGELHFKATVDKDVDQTYWLYYGNAAATIPARSATYGSENVWTNNYKAVYHMQQDPSGNGTDAVTDSTSGLNHLTPSGAPVLGTGKLSGRAIVFDGINDQLKDTDQVWPNAVNATTAQFWSNFASADTGQNATVYRYGSSGDTSRHSAHSPWSNAIYFDFGDIGVNGRVTSSAYTPFANKYSMFHFTSNGSTSRRIYADGNYEWGNDTVADAPSGDRTGLAVGSGVDLEYHKGTLDEVRFSTVARTAGWITTEYNNQNDVATFLDIGTAEDAPVYSVTKSLQYSLLLPLIETLTDNFDDNSFDTAKWTSYLNGGSGSVTEQNKRLEIVSPATGTQATGIYADGTFRLYESETIVQLLPYTPVTDHYWWFGVYTPSSNYIAIGVSETGQVHAENQAGDIGTPVAYDALLHRFFRVREASGTTYVEFSANGTSWTTHGSVSSSLYDWSECWVETYIYAQGTQSATATAFVDNIGVPVTVLKPTKSLAYSVLTELSPITKSLQYVMGPGVASKTSDDFDDDSLDTTIRWFNWGGAEVVETNDQLEMTVLTGAGNYQGMEGLYFKNMVGSSISVEVVNAGNQALASLEVSFSAILDSDNKVFWLIAGGNLVAYRKITGTNQYITQTTYSPTTHKYLRLRESAGTTYWEYSANGTSWTALHSESNPIALTSIKPELVAGHWDTEASATTVIWDNYNIVQPIITKSLQYEVDSVDTIAITKTLAYSVAGSVAITKSLAYSTQANESITKSAQYTIATDTGTTKSLQYTLQVEQSPISKQTVYKVLDTSSDSKQVIYKVSPEVGISKGLIYKVAGEVAITKSATYDVLTELSQTKGLIYTVQPDTGLTKGLVYDVITDSSITKSLVYSINTDEVTQKSMTYAVLTSPELSKSVTYDVTTDTAVTKSVKYTVEAPVALTKGVMYVVQIEAAGITKSLMYTVQTDSSITKSDKYTIITTSADTKSLDYEVIVDTPVSKTLTYRVVTEALTQLSLEYVTTTDNSATKTLSYAVVRPVSQTKSLTYETIIRRYSKEAGTLRTTDVTLDTIYTTAEEADAAVDDGVYVTQAGAGYLSHQFKAYGSDLRQFIRFTWIGKASVAPTVSTVYMQLYDYTLAEWVTVASNNTAAADTDFTLAALVDVAGSDYHGPDHTVTGRVYQQVS